MPGSQGYERILFFNNKNSSGSRIRFTWCPAHRGIKGNERADREAKEAAVAGIPIHNRVDFCQIVSSLVHNYEVLDDRFRDSLNQNAGIYYLQDPDRIDIGKINKLRLNRDDGCALSGVITGYAYTNHFKYKIGVSDSPGCECGYPLQDINHIFWNCQLNSGPRVDLINSLLKKNLFPPFTIKHVLAVLDIDIARAIIKFIRMSKLTL